MSTQLLFYKQATPVSREHHSTTSIDTNQDYSFASQVNSVPLTATEFPHAARDYVIVFAGKDTPMPAVILGAEHNRNVFVSEDGHWEGRYIPAFVRRYPFVFSSSADGSTFTLCIDQEFQGLNQDNRGEKLKELDLLEPMQAQISLPSGSQLSLTGFQVINRDRLKALDGDKLAELARNDALELAYLHLYSLNNFSVMVERSGQGSRGNN